MDYKQKLLDAQRAYYNKVGNATYEDHIKAMAGDCSVAEEEANAFIRLDYTDYYNLGVKPDTLYGDAPKLYREFLKAFKLPEPTGRPPKKKFRLPIE